MSRDNITGLPPVPPSKLRVVIEEFRRGLPDHIELNQELAKLDRAKWRAWVDAGFTEQQALELLKAEKIKASI